MSSLGANVGWNSKTKLSAGISYSVNTTGRDGKDHNIGSLGLNFNREGSTFTGDVDNTNLFTSSSDGSFQINTNFANERMTNMGVNNAQQAFDAIQNAKLEKLEDKLLKENGKDPATLNEEDRKAALKEIGEKMAKEGKNDAAGSSRRTQDEHVLGGIGDAFTDIGQAFGLGGKQASSASGFIDEKGNYHPRTCFTAGTLVTKLKIQYYDQAGNGGLVPESRLEEKVAIETIKAGDFVLSFDEGKKEKSYKKVTDTFVRTTELIYTVSFVNGEKLETTWNHPFWVLRKSVAQESGQVELGASLVTARFIDSDSMSGEDNSNLDGEWISAKDLKAGDVSLTSHGKRLLIASITSDKKSETVYNFSVVDNHTYFVGVDGVLVHNQSSGGTYPSSTSTSTSSTTSAPPISVYDITKTPRQTLGVYNPDLDTDDIVAGRKNSDSVWENAAEIIGHLTYGAVGTAIGALVTGLNLTIGNIVPAFSHLYSMVHNSSAERAWRNSGNTTPLPVSDRHTPISWAGIKFGGPAGENDIISSYGGFFNFGDRKDEEAFTIGPFVHYIGRDVMEDVPNNSVMHPNVKVSRFGGIEQVSFTQHERGHVRQNLVYGPLAPIIGFFGSMLPQARGFNRVSDAATTAWDRDADERGLRPDGIFGSK